MPQQTLSSFSLQAQRFHGNCLEKQSSCRIGNLKVGGFIAWFIWMAVHLISLIGFRNKVVTLLNWMKKYFSSDSGIRLIITHFDLQEEKRKRRKEFEKWLK